MKVIAAALLVLSLLFWTFPALDIAVARLFYVPGEGFPLQQVEALVALRRSGNIVFYGSLVAAVVVIALRLLRPASRSLVPVRDALFLLLTAAAGPGLLINGLLKPTFGRARPVDVPPFSQNLPFTRAWEVSPACSQNCSFPSGEGGAAAWLIALALLAPPRWRRPALVLTAAYALALSLNRMAFGGHFVSDIAVAWGLVLLLILLIHRALYDRPPGWLTEGRIDRWFARGTA